MNPQSQSNIGPAPKTAPQPSHFPSIPGIYGASGPRTLVSVWPLPLRLTLRHEGSKTYEMEAAPKGQYQTLTLHDTVAFVRNWSSGQYFAAPVPASVTADNLVHAWTRGLVGTHDGLGPGVVLCAGPEPTTEEVERANAVQVEYFRSLIGEADNMSENERFKVTDLHRLAADWMGVKDRKWAKPIEPVSLVPCPACGEEIRNIAKVCRWCNTNLTDFAAKEAKAAAKAAQEPSK